MNRLTSDNVLEMNMHDLALNQVYIGQDGWAWYRNGPEDEVSVCDLIRTALDTLGMDGFDTLNDDELSDLLVDWLQFGVKEPEGVLATLYQALWAMAEVRAKLFRYEDTDLEPEEIKEVQEAMAPIPFGRIHDIMEAERAGRLVLPSEVNEPLMLDELREMDGEPVWVVELNGYPPHWGLVYWCRKNKRNIVYVTINNGASICAEVLMAAGGKIYRRKPEEEAK